jgi:ABC-type nitrate/sulfonate/bicarbonate transport system substrate-binding protein
MQLRGASSATWMIARAWAAAHAASLAAVLMLVSPNQQAFGADPVELPSFEIAAVRDPQLGSQIAIADAYGYFKDEGLTVTVRWNQSAADILTLMAGGSQNIGTGGAFTQIVFAGQKLPIKTITTLADIAETQGFALGPNVKLASPKELEGKKLAYTQGNSQILILAKMAAMYNFDMSKITLVNMQPSEGVVATSKGDVTGFLGWQPNLYRVTAMGGTMYATGTSLFVTGTAQPLPFEDRLQYNHSTLMVSDAWIEKYPNTLKAMLRALKRATDLINTDRAKALVALEQQLRIDPEPLKVMVEANKYGLTIDPSFATTIAFQSDWAMTVKRIPEPVKIDDVVSTKLLESVDPKLVTWKPKS